MVSKLRIVLIFVAVVVFGIVAVSIYLSSALSSLNTSVSNAPTGNINASVYISRDSFLQYNNSEYLLGYALMDYSAKNASQMNLSFYVYNRRPVEEIYLVNTQVGILNYCVKCFDQGTLSRDLGSALATHGLVFNASSLNYINMENLSEVPRNSIVVLQEGIITTGLLPFSSYGGQSIVNGNVTILTLLNRGDTIIYVGRNFSTTIGSGGNIFLTPNDTIEALANVSINTEPFFQNQPNSTAGTGLVFRNPTFNFVNGKTYGNVTSIDALNGTIIALSNYPTSGWRNVSDLAGDIATVIDSRFWISRLGYGYSNFTLANNASVGKAYVLTASQYINNTASERAKINGSYSLIVVRLSNQDRQMESQIPFEMRYNSTSTIGMPAVFGEEQSLLVTVNSGSAAIKQDSFHLNITSANGTGFPSQPIGFYNRSFDIAHYYTFALPSGYYIASLQDGNGKTYTQTLFSIAGVTITPTRLDFRNGTFTFVLISNRVFLSNATYTATINGAYPQNGVIENGTINYTLPRGSAVAYGNKVFAFSMFGATYSYPYDYASQSKGIPPLYIEFAIVAIFVIVLNLILKAPTADDYFIDVPNFPPAKRVKLKTDSNSIIGVFDTVNFSYHWKYMPLTAEEIKTGVSASIRYESVPIAVTLQNITSVLNKMVHQEKLVMSGGYYAPVRWVTESKHNIEYLTIFRKIRDFCVANAMLFTDLDADQHVDMIITRKGSQSHIIINTSISGMKDIALNSAYKVYIAFLNESQRLDFLSDLYDAYGDEAELLKIGIEYDYIVLIDMENIEQLLV